MNDSFDEAQQPESAAPTAKSKRRLPLFSMGLLFGFIFIGGLVNNCIIPVQRDRARAAELEETGMKNLRMVGLATQYYSSAHNGILPPAVLRDDSGQPRYSWRVAALEFLDGAGYFNAIDLSEPADSKTNKPLLATPNQLSARFQVPGSPEAGTLEASFFVITGDKTPFPAEGQISPHEIAKQDGTSRTLMFVEAADMQVEWTRPEEIPFEALNASPRDLHGKGPSTHRDNDGPIVLFCDGHGKTLNPDTDPAVLRALATWRGTELLSRDDF